jgi:hypothetical protein
LCAALPLQASERLVQLSYAVLERFGLGVDAGSSSSSTSQQQQPYSNGNAAAGSRLSGIGKSGSSGSLVSIAAASVEYTAFAPLVVSTLKVRVVMYRCIVCRRCCVGRCMSGQAGKHMVIVCVHAHGSVHAALGVQSCWCDIKGVHAARPHKLPSELLCMHSTAYDFAFTVCYSYLLSALPLVLMSLVNCLLHTGCLCCLHAPPAMCAAQHHCRMLSRCCAACAVDNMHAGY